MPRLLSPRPLVAGVAVLVALALGACGQDEDVTRDRFAEDLLERTTVEDEPTISEEGIDCIADAVFDEYDQAEINRIYRAATEDELTTERRDELLEIIDRCQTEHPLGDGGS